MSDLLEQIFANVSHNWIHHLKIKIRGRLQPVILMMSSKSMVIYNTQMKMIRYLSYAEFEITSYVNTNTVICDVRLHLQGLGHEI